MTEPEGLWQMRRILWQTLIPEGFLSSFPEEKGADESDYSCGRLLSGNISEVPAREYHSESRERIVRSERKHRFTDGGLQGGLRAGCPMV